MNHEQNNRQQRYEVNHQQHDDQQAHCNDEAATYCAPAFDGQSQGMPPSTHPSPPRPSSSTPRFIRPSGSLNREAPLHGVRSKTFINLSSSEGNSTAGTVPLNFRSNGNIAVRRKTSSGHKMMADVTQETGEKLVSALKEIKTSNKELETRKLDVHLDLFDKNMDYKMLRDQQQLEIARLTIQNQSLLVSAIDRLTETIGGRLPPWPPAVVSPTSKLPPDFNMNTSRGELD